MDAVQRIKNFGLMLMLAAALALDPRRLEPDGTRARYY